MDLDAEAARPGPARAPPTQAAPAEAGPAEAGASGPLADPARATVKASPGQGMTVASADGRYSLQLRARIQLRETFAIDDREPRNEVAVRTLRLIFTGNVFSKDLNYRIQLALAPRDFEPGNPSPIFDAHVEYTRLKNLSIRVGQYFVPFDRARTTRELALHLVDRHQVVRELTLDRDAGIMLYSHDLFGAKERLGYALFVGGGEGRNRVNGSPLGPLFVGRLIIKPWGNFDDDVEGDLEHHRTPKLALGLAGAYNMRSTRVYGTYGADFRYGTTDQIHAAADLVWKFRGWSVTAEGLLRRARDDRFLGLVDGLPVLEPTRSGYGYFVQSGVFVSKRVELVARWDDLYAWPGTDPAFVELAERRGRQTVGGLNIYLNGHAFKIQTDYGYAFGRVFDPGLDAGAHAIRLQLDVTF